MWRDFFKDKNGSTGRTEWNFHFDASGSANIFRCTFLIVEYKDFYDILQTAEKREISSSGTQ